MCVIVVCLNVCMYVCMYGSSAEKIGSHLSQITRLDALTRVEAQFRSNNDPVSIHTYIHTCMHTYVRNIRTYIHTYISLLMHVYIQPHTAHLDH